MSAEKMRLPNHRLSKKLFQAGFGSGFNQRRSRYLMEKSAAMATKQNPNPSAGKEPLQGVDKIIAVASTKGGVGKSTVAVNLALAMREAGKRTGLLDADIHGPSIPTMLGIQDAPDIVGENTIVPVEAYGLQVMSVGLVIPPDKPLVWRGPRVFAAVRQFLKGVQWHDLDYLVVDLPPGTGDASLTLAQQVPLAGVLVVTTPQEIALADVRRGIRMFQSQNVPILGIVENMSYFSCPDSGKTYDIFGSGGGQSIADDFHLPLLGKIPIDPLFREGGDAGTPAVENPECTAGKVFIELAKRVDEIISSAAEGRSK